MQRLIEISIPVITPFIILGFRLLGKFLARIKQRRKGNDYTAVGMELSATGFSLFIAIVFLQYRYPEVIPFLKASSQLGEFRNIFLVLITFVQIGMWLSACLFTTNLLDLSPNNLRGIKKYRRIINGLGLFSVAIPVLITLK